MWVRKELKNYHFIHHMDPKIWLTVKHGSPKKNINYLFDSNCLHGAFTKQRSE